MNLFTHFSWRNLVWVALPNEIRLFWCAWNVSDRHCQQPKPTGVLSPTPIQGSFASRHAATLFAGGFAFWHDTVGNVATQITALWGRISPRCSHLFRHEYVLQSVFAPVQKGAFCLRGRWGRRGVGWGEVGDVYWQYRRVIVAATPDPGPGHASARLRRQTMSKCDISLEMLLLSPNSPSLLSYCGSTKCISFAGIWIIFKWLWGEGSCRERKAGSGWGCWGRLTFHWKWKNYLMIFAYWWMKLWHCLSIFKGWWRKFIQFKY